MIFVVGMPRSGTTLAEQIISSHSEVYGAGELSFLTEFFTEKILEKNFFIDYGDNNYQDLLVDCQKQYFEKLNSLNIRENLL